MIQDKNIDDLRIIKEINSGKTGLFRQIIDRYKNSVYNVCYRLVWNKDDAEDCAQDSFIKIYKNLKKFNPKYPFRPWLYRVAINTCYDFLRRKKKSVTLDETFVADSRISILEELEKEEQEKVVKLAVKGLAIKYQSVITLYYFEDRNVKEISQILKISESAVKTDLFRARKILEKTIKL